MVSGFRLLSVWFRAGNGEGVTCGFTGVVIIGEIFAPVKLHLIFSYRQQWESVPDFGCCCYV